MKEIRLELKNEDGQVDTFIQKHVPLKKMIEWFEIEEKIESGDIKPGAQVISKKVEYVADLFDDERVTFESICNGLDSREFEDSIQNNIMRVLKVDLPEIEDGSGK